MSILLSSILAVNVALLAIILIVFRKMTGIYREFIDFISPNGDKPSALAETASSISEMLARSLVAQAKSTFMGIQSGQVRGDNAVQAELALDVVSQSNPAIGAILSSFPALKKTLKKNPALLDLAISRFTQSKAAVSPSTPVASSNGKGKVRFNL
jgi:hypothetical protein